MVPSLAFLLRITSLVTMAAFAVQSKLATKAARPATASRRRAVVPRAALELKAPPYALDALEPHMSKQVGC